MTIRFHSYPLSIKLGNWFGWLMFLLGCWFGCWFVWLVSTSALADFVQHKPPRGSLFVFLPLLASMFILFLNIHYSANIGISDQGVYVQFMWWYIYVPWEDVISVQTASALTVKTACVRVRRLTWFHYVYGFFYPAFIIHSAIEDYSVLMGEIKRHINANAQLRD